jgi:hypothetical protein
VSKPRWVIEAQNNNPQKRVECWVVTRGRLRYRCDGLFDASMLRDMLNKYDELAAAVADEKEDA